MLVINSNSKKKVKSKLKNYNKYQINTRNKNNKSYKISSNLDRYKELFPNIRKYKKHTKKTLA